jgi:uncharacterized membrane protein
MVSQTGGVCTPHRFVPVAGTVLVLDSVWFLKVAMGFGSINASKEFQDDWAGVLNVTGV